jgi:phosphoribosyl 1,2-cyclic phosphate phosphodiesterase
MMKLEFLGTGAADYLLERDSENREFRRYSSLLIDDTILIDPGPHIFHYAESYGKLHLFDSVKTVIITHSHEDHLCAESVKRLSEIAPDCVFAGSAASLEVIREGGVEVRFEVIKPFERYAFGAYTIVPLYANHSTERYDEQTMLYSIETETQKLYYGSDTGWIPNASWDYMVDREYDAMIFELTIGESSNDYRIFGHTSLEMLKIMLRTIRVRDKKRCAVNYGCKFFTTHHARTLHFDQATLAATLAPLNVTPAYDGFITEF